ncbi:hypothetical protein GYA49_00245 [Candidatus Beckwithbacteria bacterium]|nr:hypothetical protein [Candidatus Beckwithbacteria bacterium]
MKDSEQSIGLYDYAELQSFLAAPFRQLETRQIPQAPSKEFLMWIPTQRHIEVGFVYKSSIWYLVKASDWGIPIWLIPPDADVLLHSHYEIPGQDPIKATIPSAEDFLNASPTAHNLITSTIGLTQFHTVDSLHHLELRAIAESERYRTDIDGYLSFLESLDARYEVYLWEEMSDNQLACLLKSSYK